jgi:hypothetical protein
MSKPCEHEAGPNLFKVRAWSGKAENGEVTCALRDGTDIRHCVTVRNWETTPVVVDLLESTTTTQPEPLVKFHHPSVSNVTPVRWWTSFEVPSKKRVAWWKREPEEPGEQPYSYVRLSSHIEGGSENIVTKANGKYEDNTPFVITATIRVAT